MLDSQKGIVGVAIGAEKVFATQLERVAGKLEVDKSVNAEIPTDMVQNGLILDVKGFARILKKLFTDNNIKARRVIACISEAGVITRVIKRPKAVRGAPRAGERSRIEKALKEEINKYLLSGEEAVIDHYPLDKENVFLVALKKDIAGALLSAMEKAGLDLVGIDIAPLAALRALSRGNIDLTSKKATILISGGAKKTDIGVIKGGVLSYSRDIDTVEVPELTKEIKATAVYWEEQFPAAPVEKIVVLGDTTGAKRLHVELPHELGVIEQGKPLGAAPADFNLSRSASIGSAMKGMGERFRFDVNLLPSEKFKKIKFEKNLLVSLAAVSAVLFVFFIMNFVFSAVLYKYKEQLKPIKSALAASPDVITEVEKINEERLRVLGRLNRRRKFIAQTELVPWPEVLSEISGYIPREVWLTKVSSKAGDMPGGDTLELRGKSFSQDAVYKYVRLLGFSDCFYESKLEFLRRKEEEGRSVFEFSITCLLMKKKEEVE